MLAFAVRTVVTGAALWIVTWIVGGISFVGYDNTWQKIGIALVVAAVFGLVNAVIKPIVQIIAIPLYILTLGLIHIVINALMLWITSIVLSLVSWVLSLIIPEPRD